MNLGPKRASIFGAVLLLALLPAVASLARADEPYAPSKDYNLESIRTHLWFDLAQRKVRGEVSENLAALRDDLTNVALDSVGLDIQNVTVDGKPAKFSTSADKLSITLARPAKRGERHELSIKYEGRPKKGLYFILPDENYPRQPRKSGPRVKQKTPAITFRSTTTPTTGSLRK